MLLTELFSFSFFTPYQGWIHVPGQAGRNQITGSLLLVLFSTGQRFLCSPVVATGCVDPCMTAPMRRPCHGFIRTWTQVTPKASCSRVDWDKVKGDGLHGPHLLKLWTPFTPFLLPPALMPISSLEAKRTQDAWRTQEGRNPMGNTEKLWLKATRVLCPQIQVTNLSIWICTAIPLLLLPHFCPQQKLRLPCHLPPCIGIPSGLPVCTQIYDLFRIGLHWGSRPALPNLSPSLPWPYTNICFSCISISGSWRRTPIVNCYSNHNSGFGHVFIIFLILLSLPGSIGIVK